MIKILKKCLESCKVASFYFNKEDNCVHLTGFVHCCNENELLIAHITPRGEYDGFILNRMENLYRVDYDGEYEKKIQRLYELKKQSHSVITSDEGGILFPLLAFANKSNCLVSVEWGNDKITGFVNGYDDFIHLRVVNGNGMEDGESVIDIDEVITFSCDTDYEQDLKILNTIKG